MNLKVEYLFKYWNVFLFLHTCLNPKNVFIIFGLYAVCVKYFSRNMSYIVILLREIMYVTEKFLQGEETSCWMSVDGLYYYEGSHWFAWRTMETFYIFIFICSFVFLYLFTVVPVKLENNKMI